MLEQWILGHSSFHTLPGYKYKARSGCVPFTMYEVCAVSSEAWEGVYGVVQIVCGYLRIQTFSPDLLTAVA